MSISKVDKRNGLTAEKLNVGLKSECTLKLLKNQGFIYL